MDNYSLHPVEWLCNIIKAENTIEGRSQGVASMRVMWFMESYGLYEIVLYQLNVGKHVLSFRIIMLEYPLQYNYSIHDIMYFLTILVDKIMYNIFEM